MSNYYISDLHLGHKNCLSFDNRKFKDIETHDQFIMDKWNETVNSIDVGNDRSLLICLK